MTSERLLDAAQILGELGNGKMANELTRLADRYRWRPIAEIHEDYGSVVLINIDHPGGLMVGSNLDMDYDEALWTHFAQIVPLSHDDVARMRVEMAQ